MQKGQVSSVKDLKKAQDSDCLILATKSFLHEDFELLQKLPKNGRCQNNQSLIVSTPGADIQPAS